MRPHSPGEPGPSASEIPTRHWPSSPKEHKGERTESVYTVEEDRDDSFAAVLDIIRRFHNLEQPAGVAPTRCKTCLAPMLGLQAEPYPALHLPASPLFATLLDDVNSALAKFVEDQTVNGFIPLPMKQQRRYCRTSTPSFPGPYAVPPGLASLTLDKTSEPKKRPVLLSHSLVTSLETALSGICEATSWLDWWLSTFAAFHDFLSGDVRANFERLLVSGSWTLEFLGSQAVPGLG